MAPAELILHNNWHPQFQIPNSSPDSSKNEFIRSFFGRIHGLTIYFWNYLSFNSATDSKFPRLSFYFMESYQCMVLFTSSFSRFCFIKTCLWKTLHHCHLLSCHCLGTNEAEKETSEKTLCTLWAFMIINDLIRYLYESLTLNLRGFSRNICFDFFRLLKINKKNLSKVFLNQFVVSVYICADFFRLLKIDKKRLISQRFF